MRNRFLKEILELPIEQRRNLRINKKRGRYNKPLKEEYTAEELINWAKKRNVKSRTDLKKARKKGDPNVNRFISVFGSWGAFKKEAYKTSLDQRLGEPPNDAEYILKVIVQYGAWTARKYEEGRRNHPDIFPSVKQVKNQFGKWSNVKYFAKRVMMKDTLKEYVLLRDKLGRWPTPVECERQSIDLGGLIEIHGSKKEVDSFLENMEKVNEERRRGKS